ncbi:MAG: acyl carrier protein [Candidatus Omnitrophica bacterium]|nr:acyl carrier protein [Candidatus Omnitrophota bacterium]
MAKEKTAKKQAPAENETNEKVEIIKIISKLTKIPEDNINKNSNMHFSETGIDSFALVEIIFEIENRFDISIPQDSLVSVKNVDGLVKLAGKLRKK